MIQSTFSNLPKSQLVAICKLLNEKDFEWEQPYDDFDKNFKILEQVGKYFGESITTEDYQFFAKFLKTNFDVLFELFQTKDKSFYDKIIIPIPEEYRVKWSIWGGCTYTEYYEDKVTCYDKNWVRDSIYQDESDGNFDLYEGKLLDQDYDNHEMSDWQIDRIEPIESVKNESIFTKLVLENTSSILDSLDRDSLIKMKKIIEDKLRSL